MLTGDNVVTARAIAINCGILKPNDDALVMEGTRVLTCCFLALLLWCIGPEFRQRAIRADGSIKYAEFSRIAPNLRVLARCSPTDKYNLVKGLIKMGLVWVGV